MCVILTLACIDRGSTSGVGVLDGVRAVNALEGATFRLVGAHVTEDTLTGG